MTPMTIAACIILAVVALITVTVIAYLAVAVYLAHGDNLGEEPDEQ